MIFKVSTTGISEQINLYDLGDRELIHPVVDLDLGLEYAEYELMSSQDLRMAIDSGKLIIIEKSGGALTLSEVETVASGISIQQIADKRISGEIPTKFMDLTDVPKYNPKKSYYYAVSSTSGIDWKSDYLEAEVHISSEFNGDSNGSASNPFKTIGDAIAFTSTTYSGTGTAVSIVIHPGIYYLYEQLILDLQEIKTFSGTDSKTVIIKPSTNLIGTNFIDSMYPISMIRFSIDAMNIPEFATTSGSVCIKIMDDSGDGTTIREVKIKGFYTAITSYVESNIWVRQLEIYDSTEAILLENGCLFDSDMLYIDGCRDKHIHVTSGAKAYIGESELSSAYIPGIEGMGTAVYVEDNNSIVELFAGTNIWSCDKNVVVKNGAEVKIDNSILENTTSTVGIIQEEGGLFTIINSRAPLDSLQLSIASPDSCYINAFDSTNNRTVVGQGSQKNQSIITIATGSDTEPSIDYEFDHDGGGFRTLSFNSTTPGDKSAFHVRSINGDTSIGSHPIGDFANNHTADLSAISIKDGIYYGWRIKKEVGDTPELTIKTVDDVVALRSTYSGSVFLNSGVDVNKILDEDDLASNDKNALSTQKSIKTFVENYSYSSTALNSGQLDNRYYTETEINTLSGILNNKMLYVDGSKQLTNNWDAGNYEISAGSFKKGNAILDHAIYGVITGILTGGKLTINNIDPSKVDIEAGTSLYVDINDRTNPITEILSWPTQTHYPEIVSTETKWIGVIRSGPGIGQIISTHKFSQLERRYITVLGRCWNFSNTDVITGVGNYKNGAFNSGKTVQDIAYTLGSRNIFGNVFYPTSSGEMTLSRTSGESFRAGANYDEYNLSPNIYASSTASGINSYVYHIQNSPSVTYSGIDPNYYDFEGLQTPVPSGMWSIQRVYYYPVSNVTLITYGQYVYDNYDTAYSAMPNEVLTLNFDTIEGSILRSYIVIKSGCTDLTDISQAKVFQALSAGAGALGSSGSSEVSDHGALVGLGDDDHYQYILSNGTRDFSDKIKYSSHPIFSDNTDLIDKKYVDDALSSLTTDHGLLAGLGDDDHQQYHNDERGDNRYYTKYQVDTISGSLNNKIFTSLSMPAIQLNRNSSLAVQTSWTNIVYEHIFYENNTEVLQHDSDTFDRILIKENGSYLLSYNISLQPTSATTNIYCRFLKNDLVELPASYSMIRVYTNEIHETNNIVVAELSAEDYITLQVYRSTEGGVNILNTNFNIIKLNGIKGEPGDKGDTGPSGLITISGSAYFDAYDSVGGLLLTTDWQDMPFNIIRKNSGQYTYDSNKELTIPISSTYFITGRVSPNTVSGTAANDCKIRLVKNSGSGYTEVSGTLSYCYNSYSSGYSTNSTACFTILSDFVYNDKIKIQVAKDSGTNSTQTLANASSLSVYIPGGMPGRDGSSGSGSNIIVKDDNIILSGSPHSVLNFTGSGVIASSTISGVANISIPGNISISNEGVDLPNTPHSKINFNGDLVTATDIGNGVADINITTPLFGSSFLWAVDATESSTTSTVPITKLSLPVSINAGTYRIGWYYEWKRSSTNNWYHGDVIIEETSNIISDNYIRTGNALDYNTASGFYVATFSNVSVTISIRFYGSVSSSTSYIKNARLEFWRVS